MWFIDPDLRRNQQGLGRRANEAFRMCDISGIEGFAASLDGGGGQQPDSGMSGLFFVPGDVVPGDAVPGDVVLRMLESEQVGVPWHPETEQSKGILS